MSDALIHRYADDTHTTRCGLSTRDLSLKCVISREPVTCELCRAIEYVEPAPRPAPTTEYEEWDRRLATLLNERAIPGYMHNGIRQYVLNGLMPGGFMSAILHHEFWRAWGQADNTNSRVFTEYFELLVRLPAACHGSRETVDAWCEHQGLKNQPKEKT